MSSFIREEIIEELGITRRKLKLSLKTLTGEKSEELTAVNGLILSGISCCKEGPVNGLLPRMEGLGDCFFTFLLEGGGGTG